MIKEGSRVEWNWGNGTAQGKVVKSFDHKVTRTIEGNDVSRDGEPGNKALLIEQEDGTEVLKSESEVKHITE